jgi:AraC family transcriptional regulator, activator of mtrCDE
MRGRHFPQDVYGAAMGNTTASEAPGAGSHLSEVLTALLGTVTFRAEVFFRGQMCDEWSLDTSGTGHVGFHVIGGGECWLHMRSLREPRALTRGDVVVIPMDDQHAVTSRRDTVPFYGGKRYSRVLPIDAPASGTQLLCGFLHLSRTARELILTAMPDHFVVGRASPGGERIGRLTELMFDEAQGQSPAATAVVERISDALLLKVFEAGVMQLPEPAGFYAGLADPLIGRAIAAAWKAPEQAWTVASLAERAAMSRSAFADRFATLVGKPPLEVLTAWRMQLAWRMLDHHHESVAAVATKVGYGAEAAFRKAFKRYFGIGPGEVRRP